MLVGEAKILTKSTDPVLKIRCLGRPYGSPERRDTHREWFSPNTETGEDLIKQKWSTYSHLLPSKKNPRGSEAIKTSPLGVATFDAKDEAGHWFVHELTKAHEYHPYIRALAEMGLLGASDQALRGTKKVNKVTGELIKWYSVEQALLVNPSGYDTVGRAEVMKSAQDLETVWLAIGAASEKHLASTPMWAQIEEYLKSQKEDEEEDGTPPAEGGTDENQNQPIVLTSEKLEQLIAIPDQVTAATLLTTSALNEIQEAVKTASTVLEQAAKLQTSLEEVSAMTSEMSALKQTLMTHAYAVTKMVTPPVEDLTKQAKNQPIPPTPDPKKNSMTPVEGGGVTSGGLPGSAPGARSKN